MANKFIINSFHKISTHLYLGNFKIGKVNPKILYSSIICQKLRQHQAFGFLNFWGHFPSSTTKMNASFSNKTYFNVLSPKYISFKIYLPKVKFFSTSRRKIMEDAPQFLIYVPFIIFLCHFCAIVHLQHY